MNTFFSGMAIFSPGLDFIPSADARAVKSPIILRQAFLRAERFFFEYSSLSDMPSLSASSRCSSFLSLAPVSYRAFSILIFEPFSRLSETQP